jgi:eukaryotic-like serine/threonine-protein kinase
MPGEKESVMSEPLSTASEALQPSVEYRVDQVCERFEKAWRDGPQLQEYLDHTPEPERAALLRELLRLDIAYRRRVGGTPSPEDYERRFPADAALIRTVFAITPPPAPPQTDRNLLFGITCLQLGHISRDSLIAALSAWTLDRTKSLGQILHEQGQLSLERWRQLEAVLPQEFPAPRYRKKSEEPHGEGGIGKVFVAEDRELNRDVALKELREVSAVDLQVRLRFQLEAEITARLEHPGIVPVYGSGQYADGRPFYAMRFIQGDSLRQAIHRFHETDWHARPPGERSLALRELLGQFIAVCNAVAYAHSRGVIHRDLKPGNILLGKYGETLVADWGLAKVVGRPQPAPLDGEATLRPQGEVNLPTGAGAPMGTPAYMSPEQAAGLVDELGPASDIYNLGATLYELLTGQAPVYGPDRQTILEKVRRGDWLPPRQLKKETPAALEAICCKAMALIAEERYATALELADDIKKWLADEPVKAYPEKFRDQTERWMRRHRSGVTTSVTSLLLLAHQEAEAQCAGGRSEPDTGRGRGWPPRSARYRYSARLSENNNMEDHVLTPKRKRLLKMALEFYQQFLQEERNELNEQVESGRPAKRLANLYHAECGQAYWRLATLYCAIGSNDQAEKAYQETVAIFRYLAQTCPKVLDYQEILAGACNNLGVLYDEIGRCGDAESRYREALDIQQALVDARPEAPEYQTNLAGTYKNLSMLHADTGGLDRAEAACQEDSRPPQEIGRGTSASD